MNLIVSLGLDTSENTNMTYDPLQIFIVIKIKLLLGGTYLVSDFTSNGTYTDGSNYNWVLIY